MQVSQWKSSDCVDQDRNNHAQHLHCVLCGSGEEEEEECELDEPMDMVGAGKELLTNCEGIGFLTGTAGSSSV